MQKYRYFKACVKERNEKTKTFNKNRPVRGYEFVEGWRYANSNKNNKK
jgi:hypothetical protein